MELAEGRALSSDPIAGDLISLLRDNEASLSLEQAHLYFDYPLYRDDDGGLVSTRVLVISPQHGVLIFGTSDANSQVSDLRADDSRLEHAYSQVFARAIKNRALRRSKQELSFPILAYLYAPAFDGDLSDWDSDTRVLESETTTMRALQQAVLSEPLPEALFLELLSTVEGAKGLIKPKKRSLEPQANTKGHQASALEAEIATFDRQQKQGSIPIVGGPQRIRGLAGSGKTVVLAMKAALTHLRSPTASILYTFHTKSLYQHVKRLITRFYRQFDDQDPDWDRVQILHAWGGAGLPGVYFKACQANSIPPLTYSEAAAKSARPFEYACSQLLKGVRVKPAYDYVIVDEGQDFPPSFMRLCAALADEEKFVLAYDELQTIFEATAPTAADLFGVGDDGKPLVDFVDDIVLHKCYRNPREILVCAHAAGFGFYGEKIVQMLENRDHWEDVGYRFVEGDLVEGEKVVVERPAENSLRSISDSNTIDEIISFKRYDSLTAEVKGTAAAIAADIADGLRPDDILVIAIDDRNAKGYLQAVARELSKQDIRANDIHSSGQYGAPEFQQDDQVTLSTVHKAKGNEAFMVYVLGVDAMYPKPGVKQRNMLFTSMTRAKGWLRLSGIGPDAEAFERELDQAKRLAPRIEFTYPSEEQLRIMRRDLEESASRKLRAERLLDEAMSDLSADEIQAYVTRRKKGKGGRGRPK